MKNFITLTTTAGEKFGVAVSLIKFWEKEGTFTAVYFEDIQNCAFNFRCVKESVEEISEKIDEATKQKTEFIRFPFTNDDKQVCVKTSQIQYIKEGVNNWFKVGVEGMGEILVFGNVPELFDSLDAVSVNLDY